MPRHSIPRHALLRRARTAGFGLIEVMVSILIALFVLLAVSTIYLNMKSSFNTQDQLAQLQDSERLALTMLTTTVQSAGYFADPLTDTVNTALPAATVSRLGGGSFQFAAGQPVIGTGDGSGMGSASDTIAVQFQTVSGDGLMNCQGGTNTLGPGTKQVFFNYFSVNANNELTCAVGSNGQPQVLAANVAQMRITYGTDTSGNSTPDVYLPASVVNSNNLWGAVYTVRISISFLDTTASKPGQPPVLMPNPIVQTINVKNRL